MKMPIGKFKGQPVEDMTTAYLAWLVTRDHIRFKYWALVKEALQILRRRFDDFESMMAELEVKAPPQEHWKTQDRDEQRKIERAEKLRSLETQREQEAVLRRLERQVRPPRIQVVPQIIDGGQYLRQERLKALLAEKIRRQQVDSNDVSDLI